jgi:hypothetical protein
LYLIDIKKKKCGAPEQIDLGTRGRSGLNSIKVLNRRDNFLCGRRSFDRLAIGSAGERASVVAWRHDMRARAM